MWFYGCFTNEYSVNSTEVCEEIQDNSDNWDVIVLLKTEHLFIFLKEQNSETKKTMQNSIILLKQSLLLTPNCLGVFNDWSARLYRWNWGYDKTFSVNIIKFHPL